MNVKRILQTLTLGLVVVGLVACGNSNNGDGTTTSATNNNDNKAITVVSRDSASGTRTAFQELMDVTVKEGDNEVDKLVTGSLEFDSTDKVITAVEQDAAAIGYISMGSVSDRIMTFDVDGVAATPENVKNGTYAISRPFLVLTGDNVSDDTQDFIDYILSAQGQEIVSGSGYITENDAPEEYTGSGKNGTVKISGSTSVEPLMQKLIEGYQEFNPDATFEMQCQGSSQGIKGATDGSVDIGLSSRELKAEEKDALTEHTLALDGIAVIGNKANSISNLKSAQITDIYTGVITTWSDVK